MKLAQRSWRKATVLGVTLLAVVIGCWRVSHTSFAIAPETRLLVVAPHPDDEILGAGGLIQRVRAGGGAVRILYMTSGDGFVEAVRLRTGKSKPVPADFVQYGETRRGEAVEAMRFLGLRSADLVFLEFPDGGLRPLLDAHWSQSSPFVSPETGVSHPPYRDAYDGNAVYSGAALLDELGRAVVEFRPTLIAMPDPRDRHSDHAATAVFMLMLLREHLRVSDYRAPRILLYMIHWPAWPPGWDGKPVPSQTRGLPKTAPDLGLANVTLALLPSEVQIKRESLHRYRSQESVMSPFLEAFVTRDEPFLVLDESDHDEIARLIVASR